MHQEKGIRSDLKHSRKCGDLAGPDVRKGWRSSLRLVRVRVGQARTLARDGRDRKQ